MSEDIIFEGMNITAMQNNFLKLRNTVKRQGEIIYEQERQIKALWSALQDGRRSDSAVADFLTGGLLGRRK